MTPHPILLLIAGGPGAGKTTLGRALTRRSPETILLDKDVLCGEWVDAMLDRLNSGQIDRDSKFYWDTVRPLEYSALLAAAMDNLELGKSVIVVAPFGPELRDPDWVRDVARSAEERGGRLRMLWIETDGETARGRMAARNDVRDAWKLAHWTEFSAKAKFGAPSSDLFVLHNTGRAPLSGLIQQAFDYLHST